MATVLAPVRIELLDLSLVDSKTGNLRKDLGDVSELAASIKSRGLLHPPVVQPVNGRYQVIAGFRRVAALRSLGVAKAPFNVREDAEAGTSVADGLVENLQRADIAPMDEARGYVVLQETFGWKQRKIAEEVGRTQPHVSRRLQLVNLPEEVQDAVDAGGIHVQDAISLLDLKDNPELLMRVFNNRGKGSISNLISSVKEAEAKKQAAADKPTPSDEDLAAQKDASTKRRLLTKLIKQADETRSKAITGLLKSRIAKGKMLDWTVNRLVEMVEPPIFEMACVALGIPRIQDPVGFGEIFDVAAFIAKNEDENPLRLAFACALVRGHRPLLGAKEGLTGKDRLFAESTVDYLTEFGNFVPNQGELVLIGRLDVGEIAPPEKPVKEAKPKAEKKAKAKKSKDPNDALEHQTDVRDDTKTEGQPVTVTDLPEGVGPSETAAPAGHMMCPDCQGTGTDPEDNEAACKTCEGSGWVEKAEETDAE